jgi:ABC-2 type transport system permease protein
VSASAPGAGPGLLLGLKFRELRNVLSRGERSWLKIAVVTLFGSGFWVGLFLGFDESLGFILRYPELARDLIDYLLAIFFFFLGLMLVFSNAIISWTSLFRSRETAFLMSAPIRIGNLYIYKFVESLWFSSWAFLFLGTPLMAAYGRRLAASPDGLYAGPVGFFLGSAVLIALFIFIPAGLGNLIALLIARFAPNSRRRFVVLGGGLLLGLALFVVYQILTLRGYAVPLSQRWMRAVVSNLALAQSPLCPSWWVAGGISSLANGPPTDLLLYSLALVANAALFARLGFLFARKTFFTSWCAAQASSRKRRFRERPALERAWDFLFFPLPRGLRLMMLKDLRAFVRDPVQWSQFLIFFGLLAVYFLNLRSFAYHLKQAEWKSLIGLLNLCATSLTLSTFTTRFIFPQLSLEGRRFWLLGVAPAERSTVLVAKFMFCFTGSVLVAESLVLISSVMLESAPATLALHSVATVGICFGLAGLSVGMGALYPNFREDNPSKIVSGFGGTLNLILSLAFVAAAVAATAVLGRSVLFGRFAGASGPGLAVAVAGLAGLSLAAGALPMALGFRAIRRMEW